VDLKLVLDRQYRLGLEMLRQCVDRCPDELWESGKHPRTYWRIAYHAAYFTHLYLQPDSKSFAPGALHRQNVQNLWGRPATVEPYSRAEMLDYIQSIEDGLSAMLDSLDLAAPKSGFALYKMPKIELLMLNLRHLQGHVGQLSELLMAHGVEIEWAGMG
jgi:hypothetical protein